MDADGVTNDLVVAGGKASATLALNGLTGRRKLGALGYTPKRMAR
jgi:hypothetical protein